MERSLGTVAGRAPRLPLTANIITLPDPMKAERRHALQQNALATKIVQLPNFGKIWLRRIIIIVSVLIVITLIVLLRINDALSKRANSREFLARAIAESQVLRTPGRSSLSEPLDSRFLNSLQGDYVNARENLDNVESQSHDPAMLSQALLVRGDINLFMATLPRPAAATTQASIPISPSRDEAYSEATAAYKKVLEKYSDQHMNMLAARFGLAALAEDHADWKAAREQYQAIVDDPIAPAVYHAQAREKLASLDKLAVPPMVSEHEIAPLINPEKLPSPQSFDSLPSLDLPTTPAPAIPFLPATTQPATHPK
jgi:hypothetical protein